MNRFRIALAVLFAAYLAICISSCATLPVTTLAERSAQDAEKCLQSGPCFVVQVDNGGFYEAVVRLNGYFIGRVGGNKSAPLFVHESILINGGCAQASVFFRDLNRGATSVQQCVLPGGYFSLRIDPQYHAWFVPWGGA